LTQGTDDSHHAESNRRRAHGELLDTQLTQLNDHLEADWLERARALVLNNDNDAAAIVLNSAIDAHPDSSDLRLALAGVYQQTRHFAKAEKLLRELLTQYPDNVAASFLLARMLSRQGRFQAMASTLRGLFNQGEHDADLVIQGVELLDESGRQADAAAICESEIAAGSTDPRLHAYAGMLHIQLGEFEQARERYMYAVANDKKAFEWNIPIGLCSLQRYEDRNHADFELFRNGLKQFKPNDQARASLLFALGKAHDDIGDFAQAARYFRDANAIARLANLWSRKHWHNAIASRLAAKARPCREKFPTDWAPLFIVGVPRSGTTLTAELLSRHRDVCNRGELHWLPKVAQQLELTGHDNSAQLKQAAAFYDAQLLQDDDTRAKWFIDKEPLNLLRLDLIMAMYPNARIIFCQRNSRDTALSLWSQYFTGGAQAYAYDLADIAAVIQSCNRMMSHWLTRYARSIQVVRYEELTSNPASCIGVLASWLGLSEYDYLDTKNRESAISTGSLWQARQPVYSRSVERWRNYMPYLPELLRIPIE
jgi:tetratricopeptide (TPR) repeat protein